MNVHMPFQDNGDAMIVKRSQLPPNWQSASKDLIVDITRMNILANTYRAWPKHLHHKLSMKRRIALALTWRVEVVEDMWAAPSPIEPRQLIIDKWDRRYKHPLTVMRNNLPPHWRDVRTSLIVDFVRTILFIQGFELYPQPDISWESHQAYAYQEPVEVQDDVDCMKMQNNINEEFRANLSKREKRIHDNYNYTLLGQILETHRAKEREWKS